MGYLFALIVLGFILAKLKAIPDNTQTVLAKLENDLFIPALVLGTFMKKFTLANISSYAWSVATSCILLAITVPISYGVAAICAKDKYKKNLYIYGMTFPNFGFMGNAVVGALFPQVFAEYLVYTLPMWALIYVWGVPSLLIPNDSPHKLTILDRLKGFCNPMIISLFVGMLLGVSGVGAKVPDSFFAVTIIDVLGSCMSPVAMLLTGVTVAKIDFKKTFLDKGIYISSAFRLAIIPLFFMGVFFAVQKLVPALPQSVIICAISALSMPLGLNTIVIPSAYGKDTSAATGMAIVSHLFSCASIPLMFMLMQNILLK